VACSYQRKVLLKQLLKSDLQALQQGFNRLGWSKNSLILAVQWSVLIATGPFLFAWLLIRFFIGMCAFPFRYFGTYLVPKDLVAPGEKTLAGIYNAFNRYMNLDAISYIACMNDWIKILYGDKMFEQHNLGGYLRYEMTRLGLTPEDKSGEKPFTPQLRNLLAVSREKLSKQLGHYLIRRSSQSNPHFPVS
jgi:hypothetical protein